MAFLAKIVIRHVLSASQVVIWLALALPVAAQIPVPRNSNTSPSAQPEQTTDPLGRSTPRGTLTAFVRAAHRDDYVSAARYLQVTDKQRPNTETLGRNLNELADRYFQQPISTISDSPEGTLDDGLPLDREHVGPLKIGGDEIWIELVRVKDKEAGQIWLISSETLAQIPALHASIEKTWLERVMPETLLKHTVLGISLAQAVAWVASIAIPILLLSLISLIAVVLARKIIDNPVRRRRVDTWYGRLRWPSILVLTLGVHLASLSLLGFSLKARIYYSRIVAALLVAALAWLIRRFLTQSFEYTRSRMGRRDQTGTKSLILMGERLLKVVILLVAAFLILTIMGVDTATSLAGLGIVGVAVAFGAQKTVENMLGGIFLVTDRALAVGDTCSISNRVGTVEDITLRSVRIRTVEQSLLSIPAGVLSQETIENFSSRGKILAKTTLRLRYGTSTEQIRSILDGIRQLLAERRDIETESSRVRLVDFGVRAIEIELFAYVLTSDYREFLAVREDLLLQIAGIVESAGSGFARPEIVEVSPEATPAQAKQQAV
jgi:MscS family membrane protein